MAEPQVNFEITVPPELEGGAYANFVSVWHTPFEFTVDFAALGQTQKDEQGNATIPCRVVSRVRLPVTVLFDMLKALNSNMTKYEEMFGEIKAPEARGAPKEEE